VNQLSKLYPSILIHTSDQDFIDNVYRLCRDVFQYKPKLSKDQFWSMGFAEQKCIFVIDVIKEVKEWIKNWNLNKKYGVDSSSSILTPDTDRKSFRGSNKKTITPSREKEKLPSGDRKSQSLIQRTSRGKRKQEYGTNSNGLSHGRVEDITHPLVIRESSRHIMQTLTENFQNNYSSPLGNNYEQKSPKKSIPVENGRIRIHGSLSPPKHEGDYKKQMKKNEK